MTSGKVWHFLSAGYDCYPVIHQHMGLVDGIDSILQGAEVISPLFLLC